MVLRQLALSAEILPPGLPRGWTLPAKLQVARGEYYGAMPWLKRVAPNLVTTAVEFVLMKLHAVSVVPEVRSRTVPVLSVFSGVGGLELGAAECGPQW